MNITGDWKTASAHFKSMLATERFIVEIDDVTREQVIVIFMYLFFVLTKK